MDITPKDQVETKALGIGQRITVALGIVIAAATTLIGALGGTEWITAHLPLLGTGITSLVGGGITAYVAVRRMRLDRLAKGAGIVALLLIPFMFCGCAGVYTPKLSAISWGLDSSQILSGLNVTRSNSPTNDYYEVILDSSAGQQSSGKIIDGLIAIGEIAARAKGLPVSGAAVAPASDADGSTVYAPAEEDSETTVYSSDTFTGTPGADGSGVYGSPVCPRCRAYRSSHQDAAVINVDEPENSRIMWKALRRLGYKGDGVKLPVVVTPTAYSQAAK